MTHRRVAHAKNLRSKLSGSLPPTTEIGLVNSSGRASYKKLSPRRSARLPGPRRRKPLLRKQRRQLERLIEEEHELLQGLCRDAELRRQFWGGSGRALEPLVVWTDFDHTNLLTEIDQRRLNPWGALSQYLKLQIGFLASLEFAGYSFTINIPSELEESWIDKGDQIEARIERRLRDALSATGIKNLPYAYVIETRSRSTKSRTHLHLHGYLIAENSFDETRFKVAAEKAFRSLEGKTIGRARDVRVERAYDRGQVDGFEYGRWPSYFLKSIHRFDHRVPGKRVFTSRAMTQASEEFWKLIRSADQVLYNQ